MSWQKLCLVERVEDARRDVADISVSGENFPIHECSCDAPKTSLARASASIAYHGTVYTNYHPLEFVYACLIPCMEDSLNVVMSACISCGISRVIDAIEWVFHDKLRVRQLLISRNACLGYCNK